jgi:hypothetical protein
MDGRIETLTNLLGPYLRSQRSKSRSDQRALLTDLYHPSIRTYFVWIYT